MEEDWYMEKSCCGEGLGICKKCCCRGGLGVWQIYWYGGSSRIWQECCCWRSSSACGLNKS